jgi:hypothetical protein
MRQGLFDTNILRQGLFDANAPRLDLFDANVPRQRLFNANPPSPLMQCPTPLRWTVPNLFDAMREDFLMQRHRPFDATSQAFPIQCPTLF